MRVRLGWLLGECSAVVTGPEREEFLNRCAALGLPLWTMEEAGGDCLRVRCPGRRLPTLRRAAAESGCVLSAVRQRGLPFFLKGFRRRYALMAGLLLSLCMLAGGSQVVLDIEVTGNETLSDREILSQLRLCGVGIGTFGPSVPVRTVENELLRTMDRLSFCALTFHGTRAVLSVREAVPAPRLEDLTRPADVVAAADGILLHVEPWSGDARFREGDAVLKGEVLISGTMDMDPPPLIQEDLGSMTVRAEGRVLARTWRTLEARTDLSAAGKAYTGAALTRYSLYLLGRRVNFYQNSGIPYEKYDIITQTKEWAPWGDRGLPIRWQRETVREYEASPLALDAEKAEALLKERLSEALSAMLEEGTVLQKDFRAAREGDTLTVTLLAQCIEQIGRTKERGSSGDAAGPRLPDAETTETPEGT